MTPDPATLPARLSTMLRSLDRLRPDQIATLEEAVEVLSPAPASPDPDLTPEQVRELVKEAAPGPWVNDDDQVYVYVDRENRILRNIGEIHLEDAESRLAFLAPALASAYLSEHARAEAAGRLREALEWYGEQARLCRLIHSGGDSGRHALSEDGGQRARAALAPAQEPERGA